MKHDCINPGECLDRHKADRSLWCGVCRTYAATLSPEAPKFKPGDPAIVVWPQSAHYGNRVWLHDRIAPVSGGRPIWRASSSEDGDPIFLFSESRLGPAPIPAAPKFAPGDPAIINDPTSTHNGERVWLFERGLGSFTGRPYWKAGPYKGGPWHWSVTEDSLRPVPIREPVIRRLLTFEERRAAMLARSADLAKQPSPFARRYDSREPEPVEEKAPARRGTLINWASEFSWSPADLVWPPSPEKAAEPRPPLADDYDRSGDGQAATSSLKAEPEPSLDELRDAPGWAGDVCRLIFGPRPSTRSVVDGVERWRLIDPAHRRAWTQGTGHTIEVHVTVQPSLATHRIKFCSAYSAEEVVVILDELASFGSKVPDAEVTMARNPAFEFAEDREHLRS